MCAPERGDDVVVAFGRKDGLEPQLGHALLAPHLADRGMSPGKRTKCACTRRVPGAALVLADAPGARVEERVAHGVEGLGRDEDDELASQAQSSIWARCNLPE